MRLTLILLLIVTFIAPAFNQAAAQTMAAMDISFKVGEAERRADLLLAMAGFRLESDPPLDATPASPAAES